MIPWDLVYMVMRGLYHPQYKSSPRLQGFLSHRLDEHSEFCCACALHFLHVGVALLFAMRCLCMLRLHVFFVFAAVFACSLACILHVVGWGGRGPARREKKANLNPEDDQTAKQMHTWKPQPADNVVCSLAGPGFQVCFFLASRGFQVRFPGVHLLRRWVVLRI